MVIHNLRSKSWQSQELKRWGPNYTASQGVHDSFAGLQEAASTLGRPDLADELESRISVSLCEKYAPLLKVLQLLTGRPLEKPIDKGCFTATNEKEDPQDIWKEAMVDVEDPNYYVYSDDSDFSAEDEKMDKKSFPVSKINRHSSNEQQTECDTTTLSRNNVSKTYQIPEKPPPLLEFQDGLSQKAMNRELVLMLQLLPHNEKLALKNISLACSESISKRFVQLRQEIWKLRPLDRKMALENIRCLNSPTIVRLTLEVEQILMKYKSSQNLTMDYSALDKWLNGDANITFNFGGVSDFISQLPLYMHHLHLAQVILFARISRIVFDSPVPKTSLEHISTREYAAIIERLYLRNSHILMEIGLRELILTAWKRLSAIYLAQDSRMVIYIDKWILFCKGHSNPTPRDANLLMNTVWPEQDLVIDGDFIPRTYIELPACIEQVYGENLSSMFNPQKLRNCWITIVDGVSSKDGLLELEMKFLAQEIELKIFRTQIPDPSNPNLFFN